MKGRFPPLGTKLPLADFDPSKKKKKKKMEQHAMKGKIEDQEDFAFFSLCCVCGVGVHAPVHFAPMSTLMTLTAEVPLILDWLG